MSTIKTSGLENPLSHLLLALTTWLAVTHIEDGKDRLFPFGFSCALIYLNRPDALLLVAPLALYIFFASIKQWKRCLKIAALCAIPIVAWTSFSLFYYGFPFPNTAYAKLGHGFDKELVTQQGWRYVFHTVEHDPLTALIILSALVAAFFGSRITKSLALGVVLYLHYVISIGGDFMEGRFFSTAFFMSLIILARELRSTASLMITLIPVLAAGSVNFDANIRARSTYENMEIPATHIADERGYYFQTYGLLPLQSKGKLTHPDWVLGQRSVQSVGGGLGFTGVNHGPSVHFIDYLGLTDPLLARLPAFEEQLFRPGHVMRHIPAGYEQSQLKQENLLEDPELKDYWDDLRLITSGPLFSSQRFKAIFAANFKGGAPQQGEPEHEPEPEPEQSSNSAPPVQDEPITVSEKAVSEIRETGTDWDQPGNHIFDKTLIIELDEITTLTSLDISVDHNDVYEISALVDQEWKPVTVISPANDTHGLYRQQVSLDQPIEGVEQVQVTAIEGDSFFSLGHLIING